MSHPGLSTRFPVFECLLSTFPPFDIVRRINSCFPLQHVHRRNKQTSSSWWTTQEASRMLTSLTCWNLSISWFITFVLDLNMFALGLWNSQVHHLCNLTWQTTQMLRVWRVLTHGSGVYKGSELWRTYWVQWNTRKASPARKSLGERYPATGRMMKPERSKHRHRHGHTHTHTHIHTHTQTHTYTHKHTPDLNMG